MNYYFLYMNITYFVHTFCILEIHNKTFIFIYFTTGDSSASKVSGVVNAEILHLQQMIKTVAFIKHSQPSLMKLYWIPRK